MENKSQTPTDAQSWTIAKLLSWTCSYLEENGVDEPRLSAEVLLAEALQCRRIDLYARMHDAVDSDSRARFRQWVLRAAGHEPIAYIVGHKEFYSLSFRTTPAVLIPRPETESLVECVIDLCASESRSDARMLDLGTGSGCIGIAVLSQLPDASVVATDCSEAALEIARDNAERLGVSDRFVTACADGLDVGSHAGGGFDVVMSNPPYVGEREMSNLEPTVRDFEPRDALTDGSDGLRFYRMLGSGVKQLLRPGGCVVVEVGEGQASAVRAAMTESADLQYTRTICDRVVGAERVLVFRGL